MPLPHFGPYLSRLPFLLLLPCLLHLLLLPRLSSATPPSFLSTLLHPCVHNPFAISELTQHLNQTIIGQELAVATTLDLLSAHLSAVDAPSSQSGKALVLSFHGLTGTGKTFLSRSIAAHLFTRSDTAHIHHFHGMRFSDPLLSSHNAQRLYAAIIDAIEQCPLSLFILEEVHFMQPEVLSALLPLFSHGARHDQLDVTKAVFLLTSNIGGKAVQKAAYDAEQQGVPRHLIDPRQLTPAIQSSFAGQQLLKLLVDHAVVNAYVPFFPLFKSHVQQCVAMELQARRTAMVKGG